MTKEDLLKEYDEYVQRTLSYSFSESLKLLTYTEWLEQELLSYKDYYD